ncbi:MAG: RrF2 family transcriptional regulator [Anaerolineae bacterium]
MRISSRGEYGLRALCDLAQHYGEGPIPCADIAARQQIPINYLNQLLLTLRRAGFVRSLRGPQGGHLLARPPDQITLSEAIAVLDGSTAPVDCVSDEVASECKLAALCLFRDVWQEVKEATDSILSSKTLADMCRR